MIINEAGRPTKRCLLRRVRANVSGMQDHEEKRIAIVGAGATGIVAARELRRRGWRQVTIFEAQPEVGGRTRTTRLADGAKREHGTLMMLEGPVLRALVKETGL